MADRDEAISSFCALTNAPTDQATRYLSASGWNVDAAVSAYCDDMEDAAADAPASSAQAPAPPGYTGPRTLDGRPAPEYASSSSSRSTPKNPPKKKGIATLSSVAGPSSHGSHEGDDDDDDDDEADGRRPRDLFAGGEKSGLAVQDPTQRSSDPRQVINDIIAKAKANAARPGAESPSPAAGPSRRFRGPGQTLGGDGVESRVVPDPRGEPIPRAAASDAPPQERTLHLWADGFSVDDGPLHRFDDPQNTADLNMIRQGRAPLHLMNVRHDQPVDVKVQKHNENWRQLPRIYRPFSGTGHRLGSPVPSASAYPAPPPSAAAPAQQQQQQQSAGATQTPAVQLDESQPTLALRIQMPDGTRLPARFNASHTVEDVYQFVQRAFPAANARPWVLATTFPNKDHTDRSLVLGEMPEFKKGGTAVVKWV